MQLATLTSIVVLALRTNLRTVSLALVLYTNSMSTLLVVETLPYSFTLDRQSLKLMLETFNIYTFEYFASASALFQLLKKCRLLLSARNAQIISQIA